MARRSTPERIDQARHDALRNRLIGTGLPPATADAWIAAWIAAADAAKRPRDAGFWSAGWAWIQAERATRAAPRTARV